MSRSVQFCSGNNSEIRAYCQSCSVKLVRHFVEACPENCDSCNDNGEAACDADGCADGYTFDPETGACDAGVDGECFGGFVVLTRLLEGYVGRTNEWYISEINFFNTKLTITLR